MDTPGFNYTSRPDIDALQILATERERRISFYIRGSSGRLEKTSTVVLGHPAQSDTMNLSPIPLAGQLKV